MLKFQKSIILIIKFNYDVNRKLKMLIFQKSIYLIIVFFNCYDS